jgi:hypothetical protein
LDPTAIKLTDAVLDSYAGVYQLSATEELVVRRDSGKLLVGAAAGATSEFLPMSETEFFVKDSRPRLRFTRDAAGAVTGLVLAGSSGIERSATKTSKSLPTPRPAGAIDPSSYERYAGVYELAPGFSLTITRAGTRLMAQATGQPQFELFPESPTIFFAKEVEVKVEFVMGTDGKASSLVLHQGGQKLPGKKM